MEQQQELVVNHTRTWIREVVIGLSFCPFAAQPFQTEKIRYKVLVQASPQTVLETVIREAYHLDQHTDIETTLILLPEAFSDFMEYLDLLDISEQLLVDQGYEGIYQVASFHPEYQFADTTLDDPANYTNRSPYPMLHLIREDTITRVLENYPDPENIPERNRSVARSKGLVAMMALREACMREQ